MPVREAQRTTIHEAKGRISVMRSSFDERGSPVLSDFERAGIEEIGDKELEQMDIRKYLSERDWNRWERMTEAKRMQLIRRMKMQGIYRQFLRAVEEREALHAIGRRNAGNEKGMYGAGTGDREGKEGREASGKGKEETRYGLQGYDEEMEDGRGAAVQGSFQTSQKTAGLRASEGGDGSGMWEAGKAGGGAFGAGAGAGSASLVRAGARAARKAAAVFRRARANEDDAKKRTVLMRGLRAGGSGDFYGSSVAAPAQKIMAALAAGVAALVQATLLPLLLVILLPVFLVLTMVTILSTIFAAGSVSSGRGSTAYLAFAREIAEDDTHGYSQARRVGNPDYDCSSLVSHCLVEAGYKVTDYGTTVTLWHELEAAGFEKHSWKDAAELEEGDIVFHYKGEQHVEFYCGDGRTLGAHGTGYAVGDEAPGDQTGKEISETTLGNQYDYFFHNPNTGLSLGSVEIPEGMGDTYSYTIYTRKGCYVVGTGDVEWAAGTGQRRVHDAWLEAGAVFDRGLAMIGDRYLIACSAKFGQCGDLVTFYLDDGTPIPCIIADAKNSSDPGFNEWGHSNGHNVIEFEVDKAYAERNGGNPGSKNWFPELSGHRVASADLEGRGI